MLKEIFLYIFLSTIFFKIYNKYISELIIDKPNFRSSHKKEVPTSGGLIFLLIHLINIFFTGNYNLLILLPIGAVGFIDDLFNIKQFYRFLLQIINIYVISELYVNFDIFKSIQLPSIILFLIILVFGLTLVNCVNFMDGIDGLVASNMLLISLNYTFLNNTEFIGITSSLLVFLFYNCSPAKLFMGDTGSTFLGLVLFYMISTSNDLNSALILFLTASPLLMDSLVCILRRFINNENIFSPHKKHLYQRLHQNGMSHSKVSIIYGSCTFILVIFSQTNNLIIMSSMTLLVFLLGTFLEKYYALPFKT